MTGLLYYRTRFYDSQLGRFISEDPIGLSGGINSFAYVSNNPQNSSDPSGLFNEDVHFYLTYFLVTKFSCLTPNDARLIAEADQGTDENADTAPWLGISVAQAMRNANDHAFTSFVHLKLAEFRRTNHSHIGLGHYLHFLQDSYSHKGFSNMIFGQ